jgi:D-serine deaminase-like pyridoxal phosphate-dependent protein
VSLTGRDPAYDRYRAAVAGERLPLLLCDLDALERNVAYLCSQARPGQPIRLVSKSVRCPGLLHRIAEAAGQAIRGVMAYAALEAAFLVDEGFADVLVAYPTMQASDLELLAQLNGRPGVRVALVIDSVEHLDAAARVGAARDVRIPLVLEVDCALHAAGVHLGVLRSPLRTAAEVIALARNVLGRPGVAFGGLMAYEAQIAGVGERNPFSRAMNPARAALKRLSVPSVTARRRALADEFAKANITLPLFNGGGTGSLVHAAAEPWLTEVAVGSGFLCSHLFDYYAHLHLEPAALFALQVARTPAAQTVTCSGGGYVASGAPGRDRLPVPHLPAGLELVALEGAGEVQTPVRGAAAEGLRPGDPVFFRHAKAGEVAEHFNEYLLVRGDRVVGRAPTYRGLGKAFL